MLWEQFLQLYFFSESTNISNYILKARLYNISTRLLALYLCIVAGARSASAQLPVANFTASPLGGCSPLIVLFEDQSTGNPTQWHWDFGNGNTSSLQNPTASYFTTGNYTVSLTVISANGSNTLTRNQYITVYEPPVADFSASPTSGCFPLRVNFTDLSTAGAGNTNVSWLWDFGNGTTSTSQNPQTTYLSAGLYTITLKVTNDKGCTKTASRNNFISVTNGVSASFTNSAPLVCAAPALINFNNTSTGPPTLSYQWDFGDGNTSTQLNPSHTYAANGSYIVTLVVNSSAGCIDTVRSNPILIGGFTSAFTVTANVCINQPVIFANTSNPLPLTASWSFGDGGTDNFINSSHVYTTAGNYTVWLYNNYSGCRDSVSQNIVVNPAPVADFSAPVTSSCQAPLTVNFQDLTTGSPQQWNWDFGDGGTSNQQNPFHTYTAPGAYTVTLIVQNATGCADTLVRAAYVNIQRAQISIPQFPAAGCVPLTVSLTPVINSFDPIVSYQWDFGDGGTSTLANPVYTYNTQGTYTVQLYVVSASGCRDTLIVGGAVEVGTHPLANFSATPIPVCGKQPVFFTNLSSPATLWHWNFGDGSTSNLANPVHQYMDTGYFNITLVANNNGCKDSLVKINYVRVLPPIAIFNSQLDCNNRLWAGFTDQSIAPQTWHWDFGDGNTSAIQNPAHTYGTYGIYNVQLIVTNGSCADTAYQTLQMVNENPDFTADRRIACKEALINFTASNVNLSNVVNFFWRFGDGGSVNSLTPFTSHLYMNSGSYTVTLITTDINGCMDSLTKTNYIQVNGPTANFNSPATQGCAGYTALFNDLSLPNGGSPIVNWQWDFGDGNTQNFTAPPFQHVYATANIFSVKLIISDAVGCKDSLVRTNYITTSDPVTDFFTADSLSCPGATVQFTNLSSAGLVSYLWHFGDGDTSTAAAPSHVYANNGQYTVSLDILDPIGCREQLVKPLYVTIDLPRASFNINDTISSCIPIEVQFTNTSHYFSSLSWDFGPGQGNSALPNPVHYYSAAGTYNVRLLVTSPGGCMDSAFRVVHIYDTIGSRVHYLPIDGCKPLFVDLDAFTPGPMASFIWDFGDGYTDTTFNPVNTHLYSTFGNFLPKVIMQDPSGCLIPLEGLDTVYVTGAAAKFGLDKKFFCDQGLVTFSDSTTFNDPIRSFNWSFGDGAVSTQQNPVHQYNTPGIFTVQLAIETAIGCRDTARLPNIIKVVQSPQTDIVGDTIVCVNTSLAHQGLFLVPDTAVVHWQWSFPNGAGSTVQNPPAQVYNVPGDYTILSIATDAEGCADTTRRNLHVKPLPTVTMPGQMTIQAGFPVTIPAQYSSNTNAWIWSPATGLSCFQCPNPDAGPKFNTYYEVFFRDVFGCTNKGNITVSVICKNANLFIPNTFSPNGDGNNDVFYPRGKGLERVKMLRIFNRWGEVVFESKDFPVNNALYGWNGTYKGRKPEADVYVYQAEVYCDNGEIIKLNGNISLLR